MKHEENKLADGLYQIGKGPTSLWLYVKDGILHLPTKGLNPVAWLHRTVTMVNQRPFLRASVVLEIAPHYREYVETFAKTRGLKL